MTERMPRMKNTIATIIRNNRNVFWKKKKRNNTKVKTTLTIEIRNVPSVEQKK